MPLNLVCLMLPPPQFQSPPFQVRVRDPRRGAGGVNPQGQATEDEGGLGQGGGGESGLQGGGKAKGDLH